MTNIKSLPDNKSDYYGNLEGLRTFDDDYSGDPIYWVCNYCGKPIHQDELWDHLDDCVESCNCNDCTHEDLSIDHCEDDHCMCCWLPLQEKEAKELKIKEKWNRLHEIEEVALNDYIDTHEWSVITKFIVENGDIHEYHTLLDKDGAEMGCDEEECKEKET